MQKHLMRIATATALIAAGIAVFSPAQARTHHRLHRYPVYGPVYGYVPWYGYRYGNGVATYRYPFQRFDSNLNPDRQMVGVFD